MLERILTELQELELCGSPSQFSREWLGRDQSYYRSLRWHKRQPSIDAIRNCAAKLDQMADCLMRSGQHRVAEKGMRLLVLRGACEVAIQSIGEHGAIRD